MTARLRRLPGDHGAASTQLVLVTPVLLLTTLLVVQFALTWHARHIAQYAARRGLAAARVEDGSTTDGRAQAQRSLDALGSRILTTPSVRVNRTTARTTVRVSGTVMAVVPGWRPRIVGTASGPTERITAPTAGVP